MERKMTLGNTRCRGQRGNGCISQASSSPHTCFSLERRSLSPAFLIYHHISIYAAEEIFYIYTAKHASLNFSGLLNSFDNSICLLQWELLRSEMSYLLCCFYSPPSVYFSFIRITLNIFPRFFCCELVLWNTELDWGVGLFMRSNEEGLWCAWII